MAITRRQSIFINDCSSSGENEVDYKKTGMTLDNNLSQQCCAGNLR
jgi:hypothetical protein